MWEAEESLREGAGEATLQDEGRESGGVPAGPVTHHGAELRRKLEIPLS